MLKCLVCGMNINKNNFDKNSYTYIEKNHKDQIMSCPFCGVSKRYLSDDEDMYKIENRKLDDQSIRILDHAMKLEIFNGEFYEEASNMAERADVRELFYELKNIEYMHAQIHRRLAGFKALPKLHKPDYSKHDSDKLLLLEAENREKHAILFYKKNMDKVSNPILKEVFAALSEVEKQHEMIAHNF